MPTESRRVPGMVLEILEKSVKGRIREPNLSELAQHFFDLAGGERQVAKMLLDEYNRVDCTSSVRSKIIQFMLQHLRWINERSGTIDQLGVLTDDDLAATLNKHIREVARSANAKAKAKKDEQGRDSQSA
jgi:hypothetical protein